MSEYAKDFTTDEIMLFEMVRQARQGDLIQLGAAAPMATVAVLYARAIMTDISINVNCTIDPAVNDAATIMYNPSKIYENACGLISHEEAMYQVARGLGKLQYVRPVQIDKYGSINLSCIGDYHRPKIRFFSIATSDVAVLTERIVYYVPEHSRRVFLEKLDFLTAAGHLEEGRWRRRMGIKAKGPVAVISNLATMDFTEETKRMRLKSVHPGISVDMVKENTGFELILQDPVYETEPPAIEELKLLRENIDPIGLRKLEFAEYREEVMARIEKMK